MKKKLIKVVPKLVLLVVNLNQRLNHHKNKKESESKSKSKKLHKSKNGRKMSTSSRSSSSASPSRSRSPRPMKSKKNHRSRKHKLSRSHSRSSGRQHSRSRSNSYSRSRSRSRRPRRYGNNRSRNFNGKPRNNKNSRETRDIPPANRVLGCFGLSNRTTEDVLHREFEQFGKIEKVILITDRRTGQSKGYGFIYFANIDDSTKAKEAMSGIDLDGRVIRVDYSLTKRAHSPTPGNYMGPRDRANNKNGKNKPDRNGRRRNRSASRSMQ